MKFCLKLPRIQPIKKNCQAKSFVGNLFKQEGLLKKQIMISKFSSDTGIIESKIAAVDTPVLISNKFSFTEGPAVDNKGNIFLLISPMIKSGSMIPMGNYFSL